MAACKATDGTTGGGARRFCAAASEVLLSELACRLRSPTWALFATMEAKRQRASPGSSRRHAFCTLPAVLEDPQDTFSRPYLTTDGDDRSIFVLRGLRGRRRRL